jgi:hypothetical protein
MSSQIFDVPSNLLRESTTKINFSMDITMEKDEEKLLEMFLNL